MNIKIDFLSDTSFTFEDVREFYKKEWGRATPLMDEKFFSWQFLEAPSCNGRCSFVVAYDCANNAIVGGVGITPKPFVTSDSSSVYKGADLTSLLVSLNARGLGLSSKILEFCQTRFDIIFAAGISQSGLQAYHSRKFRYYRELPRFIKVVNKKPLRSFFASQRIYENYLAGEEGGLYYYSVELSSDLVDFESVKSSGVSAFCRNKEHVRWRYFEHPYFKYRCFLVYETETKSSVFVSVRIDELKPFTLMHVMDIYGDKQAYPSALSFISCLCKDNNVDVVDFYSTQAELNSCLIEHDWLMVHDTHVIHLPHLFHPLELRSPATSSFVVWSKFTALKAHDFSRIYFSKQDANLDRPVIGLKNE